MKDEEPTLKEEDYVDQSTSPIETPQAKIPPPTEPAEAEESSTDPQGEISPLPPQQTFTKNFVCNVCYTLFHSMKELGHHVADHAEEWPYKCEFCVVLFDAPAALLEHRLALHAVGTTYVCSVCSKEFVYLSNLKHHQEELHPGRQCSYTEEEKGKLRPQNYNCSARVSAGSPPASASEDCKKSVKKEEDGASSEEQPTTVKTTAATEDSKVKEPDLPDVRLGINQHYPSFKPPPFLTITDRRPGSMASATNFTTHNIPQSFRHRHPLHQRNVCLPTLQPGVHHAAQQNQAHGPSAPRNPKRGRSAKTPACSLTKENNGHCSEAGRCRRAPGGEAAGLVAARGYASTPAKRPAILSGAGGAVQQAQQDHHKESMQQQNQESSSLGDLPVTRTFNPSMRQYGRSQAGVKRRC
ncbi:hypothetical protein CRUP_009566 [Coryphaenoides rupestris]|nr:hypothetical protein CRUP_009566 [Coryphaenoides rupestris]